MQLKSILAVCALALVGVNADAKTDAHRACLAKGALFIEARDDPSDTRYGCLTNMQSGDGKSKYCVNYDGSDLCYEPSLGNINSCVYNHREYNGRGCAYSLSYLYKNVMNDEADYQATKKNCPQKKGYFVENNHDLTDHRFACLLPSNGSSNGRYCVTYDGINLCYERVLGNIAYCDSTDKNYHGRGCAMSLGGLWEIKKQDDQKRELSKSTCSKKGGYYLESPDKSDSRFACLQEKSKAENTYICHTYSGKNVCYNERLSNIDACVQGDPDYNGRGCAYSIGYLWDYRR